MSSATPEPIAPGPTKTVSIAERPPKRTDRNKNINHAIATPFVLSNY